MSINPITGDKLISKPSTKEYEDNWEKIFGNKKESNLEQEIERLEKLNSSGRYSTPKRIKELKDRLYAIKSKI